MRSVLIIEDDIDLQELLKMNLEIEWIRVIQANTVSKAEEVLNQTPFDTLDIISFDFSMPEWWFLRDTLEIISKTRRTFKWLMIAASDSPWSREKQMKAWCNIDSGWKWELAELIIKLAKK